MEEERHRCVVNYQVATYSGEEIVYCDPNDDNEYIVSKAKQQLKRRAGGSLPFGYQSFNIVEREIYDGE